MYYPKIGKKTPKYPEVLLFFCCLQSLKIHFLCSFSFANPIPHKIWLQKLQAKVTGQIIIMQSDCKTV